MPSIDPKKAKELRAQGMPIRDIAEKFGVKRRYVEEILQNPLPIKNKMLGQEKALSPQPIKVGKKKFKK